MPAQQTNAHLRNPNGLDLVRVERTRRLRERRGRECVWPEHATCRLPPTPELRSEDDRVIVRSAEGG